MKTVTALLGLLVSQTLLAVVAPKIIAGDYLLVYGKLVDCGSDLQAIDYAKVTENGFARFFGDVSLMAKGRSVHEVRNELVDVMERRTGHRSKSLELVYVSGTDKESVAKWLVQFSTQRKCAPLTLPPHDPNSKSSKEFERIVQSPNNKSLQRLPQAAAAEFKR